MNGLEIKKKDFLKMSFPEMMEVYFDNVVEIRKDIKMLKRRRWWNMPAAFSGGVIGGILAQLGLRLKG